MATIVSGTFGLGAAAQEVIRRLHATEIPAPSISIVMRNTELMDQLLHHTRR